LVADALAGEMTTSPWERSSSEDRRRMKGATPAVRGALLDHAYSSSEHLVAALPFER
jgi:hypothetical protein